MRPRNNRLLQLVGLTALGVALGLLAQAILGPPEENSSQPRHEFRHPLAAEPLANRLQ